MCKALAGPAAADHGVAGLLLGAAAPLFPAVGRRPVPLVTPTGG